MQMWMKMKKSIRYNHLMDVVNPYKLKEIGEMKMHTYYETWLQKQKDWIKAIEDGQKRKAYTYAIISIVACVAALAGIGFLAGGVGPAISNIKYGFILGVIGGGIYLAIVLCSHTADSYIKRLEKEIDHEMKSEDEKEQFAIAMLNESEGNDSVASIEFVQKKGAVPQRLCVTGDYALLQGMIPCLVRLDKLERMEVDVVQSVSKIRSGDYVIRMNYSTYPIFFYYNNPQSELYRGKKQKCEKVMLFPSKGLRDEAAKMMSSSRK